MRIRDIPVLDIVAGHNWRLLDSCASEIPDWEIERCDEFRETDTIVYSALSVTRSGVVRPIVLVREIWTYEWWGDMAVFKDGGWREIEQSDDWPSEEFVASPLSIDPSFMGEYRHELQVAGFARWRSRIDTGAGRE